MSDKALYAIAGVIVGLGGGVALCCMASFAVYLMSGGSAK